MSLESGIELKKSVETKGVRYLGCAISLSKEGSEERINKEGIKHDLVFFVSSFSTDYCRRMIEKGVSSDIRILAVKSSMLYEEDTLRTYYDCFYKNALAKGISVHRENYAFYSMFKDKVPVSRSADGKIVYGTRAADKPACLPTHPGACILWHGELKPKYIAGFISLGDFLASGPMIGDALEESDKKRAEAETNPHSKNASSGTGWWSNEKKPKEKTVRYGLTQKEIDERLEEAASRDAQFGTNEYGKLFARFYPGKFPRTGRDDYDDDERRSSHDTSIGQSHYWGFATEDPEEESSTHTDYGYLEDDDEEMEERFGYSSRGDEDERY